MKLGIVPPYRIAPIESPEFAAGLGRLAEELGFESIWAAEHVVVPVRYASRYPYAESGRMPLEDAAIPDPLMWLAWVGAATERLVLGTFVVILPQHNPLVLAKTAATLDRLCGGRLRLGVGLGWLREEAEALGTSFDDRAERADESIEVLRRLWREPVASYEGRQVRFDEVRCLPHPVQPGGIPILVGGHSKAAARRAGRLGDGFVPLGGGLETLAPLLEVMEASARAAGRDPAAIEITRPGPPDVEAARAYAGAGVTRMLVNARAKDLEGVKRQLGPFAEQVAAGLG